jgi:hypothetical protein
MRALARVALIGIALSFCMIYAGRSARTHASPPSPVPSAAQQPVAADTIIQLAELTSSDGGANDGFGVSVAISGDTIVIGSGAHAVGQNAAQGAAYVFVKPAGGWADTSTFTAELTASDGVASDNFGTSVSISGDTIVVGACNLSGVCSNGPGKAYVFVKPAGGWATTSTFDAELTPSDGGTAADSFGLPVSIGGDTVVIGSPQTNGITGIGPGKAYVFVKPAAGWSSMTETAVLTASDGVNNDAFGPPSVSSDGNTVFIGASQATIGANSQQGAAYIYVKPASGWATTSNFTAKLTASDGQAFDLFSFCQNSVCLSGDGNTVIAGAPQVNFAANHSTGPGKAYIFVKPASGWATTSKFDAELTRNTGGPSAFGWSVALSSAGDQAAISAIVGAGSVYTYSKPSSGWATTSTPDNALTESQGGNFGFSVAVDANDVVAGALTASAPNSKQGAAFVFGEGQPFSISAADGVNVTSPGQSGSTTLTLSPNGGFTGTVTLSCSPDAAASETDCSFTNGSTSGATLPVDLNGSSATVTFNVTTTAPHSVSALHIVPFAAPGGLVAAAIFLFLIPVAYRRRRGTLGLAALACLLILGACGSGGSGGGGGGGHTDPGTPSGNYTFTVTGTSGSGSSAATVSTSVPVAVQ